MGLAKSLMQSYHNYMDLEINKTKETKHSFLLITSKDKGKVFEINHDGSVGYTVNGEYIIADNNKKLGIALGEAFETLVKINEETFRKQNE